MNNLQAQEDGKKFIQDILINNQEYEIGVLIHSFGYKSDVANSYYESDDFVINSNAIAPLPLGIKTVLAYYGISCDSSFVKQLGEYETWQELKEQLLDKWEYNGMVPTKHLGGMKSLKMKRVGTIIIFWYETSYYKPTNQVKWDDGTNVDVFKIEDGYGEKITYIGHFEDVTFNSEDNSLRFRSSGVGEHLSIDFTTIKE